MEWARSHPDRKSAIDRKYRETHAEKVKERKKKWWASAKGRINAMRALERVAERESFARDAAAYAEWRAKWRIIYAKRMLRSGGTYSPRYYLRIPDYVVKCGALDSRSAFLSENVTPSQRAYARELAIGRRAER